MQICFFFRPHVSLTWPRVGDGGCRHGDGNANPAAAAVLPAAAASAAATGGATETGRHDAATCSDRTAQKPASLRAFFFFFKVL